jgi:uncharacterized protein
MTDQMDSRISRVVFRPVASPLPLGMLALAVGTFAVAGLQLSWIPAAQARTVGLMVLVAVVPLQALSSIFGFLARDTAASTGMALQGAGWFSIGLGTYTGHPGQASPGLGLVLIGVATALLVPVVVSSSSQVLASAVMALTSLRFYLTGAYELSAVRGWETIAGVVGLVLAAVAFYAGLAFELEDSRKTTVLPTLRRRQGETAMTGDMTDEVSGVEHDAGVRRKL